MPRMTQQKAYVAALEARGYEVVRDHLSRRYIAMRKCGQAKLIFVGSGGSIRSGLTVSSSLPLLASTKKKLLEEGGYKP